ncbi:MAG TPA: hypothetical protein VKU01_09700 [Bryobacteraceae bacterium]|nr:hypothetical protein [Bryobacteraceae bacterium]
MTSPFLTGPRPLPPAESIRAARSRLTKITSLLLHPSPDNAEECGSLLEDVATHLSSAASALRASGIAADARLRGEVEQLRGEVKILALAFAETDRLLSGWARNLGVKAGGYTERGTSAPLMLIKKVEVKG